MNLCQAGGVAMSALLASWVAGAQALGADAVPALPFELVGARPVAGAGRCANRHADVYPGIDLTVAPLGGALTYRFDVAPGADVTAIRLRYAADALVVEPGARALRVRADGRWLRESGLRCFQDRDVPCGYTVASRSRDTIDVVFAVARHDPRKPLVVDPVIGWSSYLGGSGYDHANSVAADADGSLYVVGSTSSPDFPAGGGFDTTLGGGLDAFVAKVSADGADLVWSSYLGGSDLDEAGDVAVDGKGAVYVTGWTHSADFPTEGGFDTSFEGGGDAFVTRLDGDTAGLVWSTVLGGSAWDGGRGIAVDESGVYTVGLTSSFDFPAGGGFDASLVGPYDGFASKLRADGSGLMWSSYLGGSDQDHPDDVAVDASGNLYVVGTTFSSDFPSNGGFDSTYAGGNADAFVSAIRADGSSLLWSSFLGGSGEEWIGGVAAYGDRVHVVGSTQSADFPVAGGFDTTFSSSDRVHKAYVTEVDVEGGLHWSSYLGGSADDHGRATAADERGVYVAGNTFSSDFPATTRDPTTATAFVARVDAADPGIAWAVVFGGTGSSTVFGVAADGAGHVFAVGETSAPDFPTTGGFDTMIWGAADAFVMRLDLCGDGTCDADETCATCALDCGACPAPDSGPEPADMEQAATAAAARDGCGCDVGQPPASAWPPWVLLLFLRVPRSLRMSERTLRPWKAAAVMRQSWK